MTKKSGVCLRLWRYPRRPQMRIVAYHDVKRGIWVRLGTVMRQKDGYWRSSFQTDQSEPFWHGCFWASDLDAANELLRRYLGDRRAA